MTKSKYDYAFDRSNEIVAIRIQVRKYISLAQYKKGYQYMLKQKKKYPRSYYIASMLATLNVEDAWGFPEKQKNKIFKTAAKKLRVLIYSVNGAADYLKKRNINEYYWFSQQPKKQYLYGVKTVEDGDIHGLYSQGVGAANYAYLLMSKGSKAVGLRWAIEAQQIWERFFKDVNADYHDPWYWYALALGLQGKEKEMEKALKISAKLAKKNLKSDPAFNKLRKMVSVAP